MDPLEKLRQQFEKHMRTQGPMIYTLATRLSGDPVEAGKLTEETFLAAYRQLAQLENVQGMSAWLYRICILLWKQKLKQETKEYSRFHISSTITRHEDTPEDTVPGMDATLFAVSESDSREKAVVLALAQLGLEERALVVLRDIDDKSYDEISELLEIPLDTIRLRLTRLREYLRKILMPIIQKAL